MNANIISQMFSIVNASLEEARAAMQTSLKANIRPNYEDKQVFKHATKIKQVIMRLLEATPLVWTDVEHEWAGGDAEVSVKLLWEMQATAYMAAYHSYNRESGVYDDFRQTPSEELREREVREGAGLYTDDDDFRQTPYGEALAFAVAVYTYAKHFHNYKGGQYKWVLGFDRIENKEVVHKSHILPLSDWAQQKAERASGKEAALFKDFSKAACTDWYQMEVEQAVTTLAVWWEEPVEDKGDHHSRGERIVHRASDKMFENFIEGVFALDLKVVEKTTKIFEILRCSPQMWQAISSFKSSSEWRAMQARAKAEAVQHQMELMSAQMQEMQANVLLMEMQQKMVALQKQQQQMAEQMAQQMAALQAAMNPPSQEAVPFEEEDALDDIIEKAVEKANGGEGPSMTKRSWALSVDRAYGRV